MTETVTIASGAVNAKLHQPSRQAKLEVQRILSYRVEGAEHSTAFKRGNWDGRSSFLNFRSGQFPAGFVHFVAAHLRRKGYEVRHVRKPLPAPLGPENPKIDAFPEDPRYDYQPDVVRRLVKHGQIIAQVATGGGKCLGRDTPILMYDGTIKLVQDVAIGDKLMGPDSSPRTVLSTCVGKSKLFRVTPTKGDSYIVNDAHILSLKKTSRGYRGKNRDGEKYPKGEVVNINVEKYLDESPTFKHTHKGWRTGVNFESRPLPIDPYFFGVVMGDGTINGGVSVTTMDKEIVDCVHQIASDFSLKVQISAKSPDNKASTYALSLDMVGGKSNPLMNEFRKLGFVKNTLDNTSVRKFIPHLYKIASREDRLQILAGIIDTDGHYDGKCLYLMLKEERLFDDVLFIARSLGFAAYKKKVRKTYHNNGAIGDYFAMVISGDTSIIPMRLKRKQPTVRTQKKDVLVTGLKIEEAGFGEYFGFEIDKDRLFMLGDFTVTHNTRIAQLAYARINRPTLFLTTRSLLMYQMKDTFEKDLGVPCSVLGDGQFGYTNAEGQQFIKKMSVGMVQTLMSRLQEPCLDDDIEVQNRQTRIRNQTIALLGKFEFVILEEAHESSGNSYFEILRHCKNAHYRLALTATPFMKDDEESNMRLMASSGPIAIKVTEKMLIDRGILATPKFKIIELKKKPEKLLRGTSWQSAYRIGIVNNDERNQAIVEEVVRASTYGLSSMVLIQQTKHGLIQGLLEARGLRVAFIKGENDQAERKEALYKLATGKIDALIGTTILDVGVDVPAVGLIVLAGGGKAEVALRQRIGRGLRAKKVGPNVALIVDFNDPFNNYTKQHAAQRLSIIKETEGFGENIVSGDFDYEAYGFQQRKAA